MLATVFTVDPHDHSVVIFGIKLLGINPDTGHKLLLSLAFIAIVIVIAGLLRALARLAVSGWKSKRVVFWVRQGIRILTAIVLIVGIVSIWFSDPARMATAFGLVTAGLAFALQRVVTAVAGYFVILRGKTFNVGDRITMGGVRGDVVALGFIQTTIMEMGEPPPTQDAPPAVWVRARQYTGRIVTVTNDKIFDNPVYNYTRDFPYIWEEMMIPVSYDADHGRVEQILLEAARRHAVNVQALQQDAVQELERRYRMKIGDMGPRVYMRLTDNWIELAVRFVATDHGVRDMKDAISRDILREMKAAGIGVASSTYDIVGMPPLRVIQEPPPQTGDRGNGRNARAHGEGA